MEGVDLEPVPRVLVSWPASCETNAGYERAALHMSVREFNGGLINRSIGSEEADVVHGKVKQIRRAAEANVCTELRSVTEP